MNRKVLEAKILAVTCQPLVFNKQDIAWAVLILLMAES